MTSRKILFAIAVFLGAFTWTFQASATHLGGTLNTGLNTGVTNFIVVVPVSADPAPGTYTSLQYVSLTASGAMKIRYSTDGSEPNCTTAGIDYHVVIPVGENLTIKAIACFEGGFSSDVREFSYIMNLPTPPLPTPPPPAPSGGGSGTPPPSGGTETPTLSPEAQKADVNDDNKVDILDFNTLMVNWGGANTADFTGDGSVDILDFNYLMVYWLA